MISEKAKKLGEALVAARILTKDQLGQAIATSESEGSTSLIIALLRAEFLTFSVYEKFLSTSLGIKSIIIGERQIPPNVINLLKKSTVEQKCIFPIELRAVNNQNYLILGMVDPLDNDAIAIAKNESNCLIMPCLISLSDLLKTVRKFYSQSTPAQGVELLAKNQSDDNMVLIRPGGYEEEIAFQQQLNENTRLKNLETRTTPKEIDLDTGFASGGQSRAKIYLGAGENKFKEEILAKLELSGSDASRFRNQTYSREALYRELPEVSINPLLKVFKKLKPETKLESIMNALIEKGLLTKRDILHSAAISFVFEETEQ
jgi:hypothetical protein